MQLPVPLLSVRDQRWNYNAVKISDFLRCSLYPKPKRLKILLEYSQICFFKLNRYPLVMRYILINLHHDLVFFHSRCLLVPFLDWDIFSHLQELFHLKLFEPFINSAHGRSSCRREFLLSSALSLRFLRNLPSLQRILYRDCHSVGILGLLPGLVRNLDIRDNSVSESSTHFLHLVVLSFVFVSNPYLWL